MLRLAGKLGRIFSAAVRSQGVVRSQVVVVRSQEVVAAQRVASRKGTNNTGSRKVKFTSGKTKVSCPDQALPL